MWKPAADSAEERKGGERRRAAFAMKNAMLEYFSWCARVVGKIGWNAHSCGGVEESAGQAWVGRAEKWRAFTLRQPP